MYERKFVRISLALDARINQQCFESKKAPRLEQEVNLHSTVVAKTCETGCEMRCTSGMLGLRKRQKLTRWVMCVRVRVLGVLRVLRCAACSLPGLFAKGKVHTFGHVSVRCSCSRDGGTQHVRLLRHMGFSLSSSEFW